MHVLFSDLTIQSICVSFCPGGKLDMIQLDYFVNYNIKKFFVTVELYNKLFLYCRLMQTTKEQHNNRRTQQNRPPNLLHRTIQNQLVSSFRKLLQKKLFQIQTKDWQRYVKVPHQWCNGYHPCLEYGKSVVQTLIWLNQRLCNQHVMLLC